MAMRFLGQMQGVRVEADGVAIAMKSDNVMRGTGLIDYWWAQ